MLRCDEGKLKGKLLDRIHQVREMSQTLQHIRY